MKKILIVLLVSLQVNGAQAQIPILDIIKEGVTAVIVAVDLKIQRLQNETIWLQNAQKTLENQLSKLKLEEIAGWVEKQRALYDDYFQELWKVKAALSYYHRVREILENQVQLVKEYKAAWALFRQDKNFTKQELDYLYQVYSGILEESLRSLDQLNLVINAFVTQMSDAGRMEIINGVAEAMEQNLADLREFNRQNKLVALQRAAEKGELEYVRKWYGL